MKIIIIILLSLLAFNLVNAQTEKEQIKLEREQIKLEKKLIDKSILVEIIDISGEKHRGYLWDADSTKISITLGGGVGGAIKTFKVEDIYRLKFNKKEHFHRKVIENLLVTAALSIPIVMRIGRDDPWYYVPSGIIYALLAIPIVPPTIGVSAIPYKRFNIDYIVDTDKSKFNDAFDLMEKNKLVKIDSSFKNKIYNKSVRNNGNLLELEKTSKEKNPKDFSKIHLYWGFNFAENAIGSELEKNLLNAGFTDNQYSENQIFNNCYKVSYSIFENWRVNASFSTKRASNTTGYVRISEYNKDMINIDYTYNFFTFGAKYVYKPVNRMMLNKYDLAFGLAVTSSFLNIGSSINSNRMYDIKEGLNSAITFNYYLHRNFSFQINGGANIISPFKSYDITYTNSIGELMPINSSNINVTSLYFNFGFAIHI